MKIKNYFWNKKTNPSLLVILSTFALLSVNSAKNLKKFRISSVRLFKMIVLILLSCLIFFSSTANAKSIQPSAEKGDNKVYIRADGLACYFCAYGLERFFKKSGKIAWYDMDMKKGIVEVGFIKGKPIIDIKTLNQYVYDAGFSPREIKAEFVGRLSHTSEGYRFEVTETGQSFPVDANKVIKKSLDFNKEVTLIALIKEDPNAPLLLFPEQIIPKR